MMKEYFWNRHRLNVLYILPPEPWNPGTLEPWNPGIESTKTETSKI
jgi:hypothetical protein